MSQQTLDRLRNENLKLTKQKNELEKNEKRTAQPSMNRSTDFLSKRATKSRYISKSTRMEIQVRDQGQCQFVSPISRKQCQAKHQLQLDHKMPYAKGGSNETQNLQLLCPSHNKLRAIEEFGFEKMKKYLLALRR